jgi:UDP-galactopyranose mutase
MTTTSSPPITATRDVLLCFSHLRWDWVFQRPQQLLSRASRSWDVYFVEEPVTALGAPWLEVMYVDQHITVLRPQLPAELDEPAQSEVQRDLLHSWLRGQRIVPRVVWYYTPMALPLGAAINAELRVYDCMDELANFHGAPEALRLRERQLFAHVDVVFTGGWSLFEAKTRLHPNVHAVPSSVDAEHFRTARVLPADPPTLADIPHPRLGYCGVLDERLDLALIATIADARPDWHQVFVGPMCKIDAPSFPQRPNIHRLGAQPYRELPSLLAGFDVGLLPFALNAATAFISPTKTPEYLAAGLPVVSTPIRDVVRQWGSDGLVRIAETAPEFCTAVAASLADDRSVHRRRVDNALATHSWDATWARMEGVVRGAAARAA